MAYKVLRYLKDRASEGIFLHARMIFNSMVIMIQIEKHILFPRGH